jgi:hypothetical protein
MLGGDGCPHFASFPCLEFIFRCPDFNANLANMIWRTMCLIHGDERKDRFKHRSFTIAHGSLDDQHDISYEAEGVRFPDIEEDEMGPVEEVVVGVGVSHVVFLLPNCDLTTLHCPLEID